jgi:hypothetical protein
MIQKRYQYLSDQGTVWTDWYNYSEDDKLLDTFIKNEKYQLLHPKLLNQFRIV